MTSHLFNPGAVAISALSHDGLEAGLAPVQSRAMAFVGTLGCSSQGKDKRQDEDRGGDWFCVGLSGYDKGK